MDILFGALLGLVYVAPPGPVNVETTRRVAAGGVWTGLSLQLGSLLGDALYAVLGLVGVDLILTHSAVHLVLGLGGIGLLLYLGWSALREGWRGMRRSPARPTAVRRVARSTRKTFWIGLAMSVASPYGLAYWVSVGGVALQRFHGREVGFLGCFLLGELLWALVLPLLVGWWRAVIRGRFFERVFLVCGLIQIASALTLGHAILSSLP